MWRNSDYYPTDSLESARACLSLPYNFVRRLKLCEVFIGSIFSKLFVFYNSQIFSMNFDADNCDLRGTVPENSCRDSDGRIPPLRISKGQKPVFFGRRLWEMMKLKMSSSMFLLSVAIALIILFIWLWARSDRFALAL